MPDLAESDHNPVFAMKPHAHPAPIFANRIALSARYRARQQRGTALVESLISLLVLALGILGLAGAQARMLVETRTANSRAIAMRQIADLNERIKINRAAALAGKYSIAPSTVDQGEPQGGCNVTERTKYTISKEKLAACDVWQWRKTLASILPQGQGTINRLAGSNQLRVLVAWQLNEKNNAALAPSLDIKDAAGNTLCPANHICHIQFLEI